MDLGKPPQGGIKAQYKKNDFDLQFMFLFYSR